MRVTVVDSGSPDATPDMVEREFPEFHLVRRGNIGFSAANNLVLRESRAGAVLLLNPDTEVYAGTLDTCLARLAADPAVGMVGAKLVREDGELDHAASAPSRPRSRRSPTSPGSAAATDAGESLSQYRATHLGDDEPGEVDAVNGAFMLCRAVAVAQVGLLDEGYWLYMEDLDWCRRFWDAGWKVFYEPAAVALHVKGGSSRQAPRARARRSPSTAAWAASTAASTRRRSNPLLNAAVYLGIGAKLAVSLAITALRGRD